MVKKLTGDEFQAVAQQVTEKILKDVIEEVFPQGPQGYELVILSSLNNLTANFLFRAVRDGYEDIIEDYIKQLLTATHDIVEAVRSGKAFDHVLGDRTDIN